MLFGAGPAFCARRAVDPVVFYANSNIHPAEEYARRLATLREWAADADLEVVEGAYDPDKWEATVGRIGNAAEAKYRSDYGRGRRPRRVKLPPGQTP